MFTNTFDQRPVGTGERARSSKGHLGKKVYWTSVNMLINQLFDNQTSQNFVSRRLWNSELSTLWLSRLPRPNFRVPSDKVPKFRFFKPIRSQAVRLNAQSMDGSVWTLFLGIFWCCSVSRFINWIEHIIEYILIYSFRFPVFAKNETSNYDIHFNHLQ